MLAKYTRRECRHDGSGDAGVAQRNLESAGNLAGARIAAVAGHPELSHVTDGQGQLDGMTERHLDGFAEALARLIAESYGSNDVRCVLHVVGDSGFSSECAAASHVIRLVRPVTVTAVTIEGDAIGVRVRRNYYLAGGKAAVVDRCRQVTQVVRNAGHRCCAR